MLQPIITQSGEEGFLDDDNVFWNMKKWTPAETREYHGADFERVARTAAVFLLERWYQWTYAVVYQFELT